ncbi:ribosome maturation factor RimM [Lachnospiraceae bacterium OttesenSCG-928-E19]|nr:ribosome maturation factor RimM [Lachnospiraceae bacterium OttesenSCG-928-E19]
MSSNSKVLIGKIVAPQGLRGEVRVQTYTSAPADIKDLKIDGIDLEFVRAAGPDVAIVKIDGVNDRNGAESMRGTELYVERDSLPDLDGEEYYQTDLIGMEVQVHGTPVGHVVAMHNFGAGDILEVENGDMLSFIGADVDMENRIINL